MPARAQRYYLRIDDLAAARGDDLALAFTGQGPEAFAEALHHALREPRLAETWRQRQADPDEVDVSLLRTDPDARVEAAQADLHTEVEVTTRLPHEILRHRLNLLIGHNWTLRDVRVA